MFPTDGAVLGVVGHAPNASRCLDEGLLIVGVVFWCEVVDLGVLVESVGRVGLAFGGGTVSNIVVIVGDVIRGDQFIAGVVAVLLLIFRGTAAKKVVGVNVGGIGGVGDGGEEVAVRFVTPCDHGLIGIGEGGFEVGTCEVFPAEPVGFGDTAGGGVVSHRWQLFHMRHHVLPKRLPKGLPAHAYFLSPLKRFSQIYRHSIRYGLVKPSHEFKIEIT